MNTRTLRKRPPAGGVVISLLLCAAAGAGAQGAPGETGETGTVADHIAGFVAPTFDRPKLSPDGTHVAAVRVSSGRPYLDIINLAGGDALKPYSMGPGLGIADHHWVDDERLLVEIRYGDEFWSPDNLNRGGWHLINVKNRKTTRLFERAPRRAVGPGGRLKLRVKSFGDPFVPNALDEFPGQALVVFPDDRASWVSRYNMVRERYEKLAEVPGEIWDFYADRQGRVLAAWGHPAMQGVTFKDKVALFYRANPQTDWSVALSGAFDDFDVHLLGPGSREGTVYVLEDSTGDTLALSELDLTTGKVSPSYRPQRTDVLTAYRDTKGRVYAVRYDDHFPQWHYPAAPGGGALPAARLHATAAKQFKNMNVEIASFARDSDEAILLVTGDRDPGTFYMASLGGKGLKVLSKRSGQVDEATLAERHPIEFQAKNGARLTGYFLLPKGVKKGQRVPYVVLRGPGLFPQTETWGWNREAQLFASQGFGVLQVNTRGTVGYGRKFWRAGRGRVPTAVPQDILSGVAYAVENLAADPKRMCAVGRGWGGYAALMTAIRKPETFRCVVAIATTYDPAGTRLRLPVRGARERFSALFDESAVDDAEFRELSIPYIVRRLRTPLLMVEARQFSENLPGSARDMIRELDTAEIPYQLHEESTSRPANRLTLTSRHNAYARVLAFLREHIGRVEAGG